jgi:hypothetical protein
MSGNAGNSALATAVHYYDGNQICHAAMIIGIDANFTAKLRRMDGVVAGLPAFDDHPGITIDNDLTAVQTWHYGTSCTNVNP